MSNDVIEQLFLINTFYSQTLNQLCFTLSISETQQTYNSTGEKRHKHEIKFNRKKIILTKIDFLPILKFVTVMEKAPIHVPWIVNVGQKVNQQVLELYNNNERFLINVNIY